MKSPEHYELIISRANVAEALAFIKSVEEIGFNHIWHMRQPFEAQCTHTVYLELKMSLDEAKARVNSVLSAAGLRLDWRLLPHKI